MSRAHSWSKYGKTQLFNELLQEECRQEYCPALEINNDNQLPLQLAASYGHHDFVELIISHIEQDHPEALNETLNAVDNFSNPPATSAILFFRFQMSFLLNKIKTLPILRTQKSSVKPLEIFESYRINVKEKKDYHTTQLLEHFGKDNDKSIPRGIFRNEKRLRAYLEKNEKIKSYFEDQIIEMLEILLEKGALVDFDSETIIKPLGEAAGFGLLKVCQYLIERHNASTVALNRKGYTAFALACSHGHLSVAQYLYDLDSSVLETPTENNMTPISLAIVHKRYDVIEWLLGFDVNVNTTTQDQENSTPLHDACKNGLSRFIPRLIELGADSNAYNGSGATPLLLAITQNHFQSAIVLIEEDKNLVINARETGRRKGCKKSSALHEACRLGDLELVKCLIAHGANLRLRNSFGDTPYDNANYKKHYKVTSYLTSYARDNNLTTKDISNNSSSRAKSSNQRNQSRRSYRGKEKQRNPYKKNSKSYRGNFRRDSRNY